MEMPKTETENDVRLETLEIVLKRIIDDWYANIAEYPYLHKFMAARLKDYGYRHEPCFRLVGLKSTEC